MLFLQKLKKEGKEIELIKSSDSSHSILFFVIYLKFDKHFHILRCMMLKII